MDTDTSDRIKIARSDFLKLEKAVVAIDTHWNEVRAHKLKYPEFPDDYKEHPFKGTQVIGVHDYRLVRIYRPALAKGTLLVVPDKKSQKWEPGLPEDYARDQRKHWFIAEPQATTLKYSEVHLVPLNPSLPEHLIATYLVSAQLPERGSIEGYPAFPTSYPVNTYWRTENGKTHSIYELESSPTGRPKPSYLYKR